MSITYCGKVYTNASDWWQFMKNNKETSGECTTDAFLSVLHNDTVFSDMSGSGQDFKMYCNLSTDFALSNLMTRFLYRSTGIAHGLTTQRLFFLAVLSGFGIPAQTIVAAAACSSADDQDVHSWLHLFHKMKVSFVKDNQPILDPYGYSILEVMTESNTKYVLQNLLEHSVTSVPVTRLCFDRIKENTNRTVQRLLPEFEFLIIE